MKDIVVTMGLSVLPVTPVNTAQQAQLFAEY